MITDKILIFNSFGENINAGGPSGFIAHNLVGFEGKNYTLSSQLQKKNYYHEKLFELLKILLLKNKKYDDNNFLSHENNILNYFIRQKCYEYKIIYFHSCLELYACRKFLSKNRIVILQSHSPELPSEELKDFNVSTQELNFIYKAENYAFNRANYVVFPNEDCIPLYKKVIKSHNKIDYILSGSKKNNDVREYPLDQNYINILYIGRRNSIKGFDIILDQFKKVYKKRKDIRLIIAGSGAKINQKGVIDIGFTTSPLNWYKSVDFVINTNRKSYFDLSVLEVLSIGTPLILASNYGHKFFISKSKGVITFNNSDQELYTILINLEKNTELKKLMIQENINLYNELFTDSLYRERLEFFLKKVKLTSNI